MEENCVITEFEKQDEMEIPLSGIETSLNEISHVFIRGGEGFGKDLYGMVGGGDISSKEEIPFCIF